MTATQLTVFVVTSGLALAMFRLGLVVRALRDRASDRYCVSCGRPLATRGCPRCTTR